MSSEILKFQEFSSAANISFWHELSKKKLNVLKLSDKPVEINGYYSFSTSDKLNPFLCLEADSFLPVKSSLSIGSNEAYFEPGLRSYRSPGTLYNYNTSEDFKQSPKSKIFEETSKQIYQDINSGKVDKDPSLLTRFILLTYADIKNHQFYYLFGFPALLPSSPIQQISKSENISELFNSNQLKSLSTLLPIPQFFLLRKEDEDTIKIFGIDKWDEISATKEGDLPIVGFCDPGCLPDNPSWPLRNFLIYLNLRYKVQKLKVVCFRGMNNNTLKTSSISFNVNLPIQSDSMIDSNGEWNGKSVGWEKDSNSKISPRFVSIASTMDPLKLAEQSVDLNLKLMRWRILPSLDLEKIQNTKCLLLGAGTLGCNVARCLMSWGVRTITFVDNGKVSYSNPVRQTLFTFDDCTPVQKDKALAAAESIKKIFPAMNVRGEVLSIPMAGHAVAQQDLDNVKNSFQRLESLIKEHDVVYLLTDSRESRWLPTMLCRYYDKLLMNAALGFDSYLVVRHGIKDQNHNEGCDLGCYFCNDVIAPTDTLKDRTLDQQCTVTRPGLSMMASAIVVELMVSVLHHPLQGRAPGETQNELNSMISTPLGIVPHQLRGFLSYFQTLPLFANPYKNCTACSNSIMDEFKAYGFEFVLRVLNDSSCLTKITGIDDIQNENVNIDWEIDENSSDNGDDF